MTVTNDLTVSPQRDLVVLRENDPVAWLRDKARRGVTVDLRSVGNAAAVTRVCELADRAAPSEIVYVFAWGNNERRAELKGRSCRILERGGKGTVLVEFLDTGERVTCSFRALRRTDA